MVAAMLLLAVLQAAQPPLSNGPLSTPEAEQVRAERDFRFATQTASGRKWKTEDDERRRRQNAKRTEHKERRADESGRRGPD